MDVNVPLDPLESFLEDRIAIRSFAQLFEDCAAAPDCLRANELPVLPELDRGANESLIASGTTDIDDEPPVAAAVIIVLDTLENDALGLLVVASNLDSGLLDLESVLRYSDVIDTT